MFGLSVSRTSSHNSTVSALISTDGISSCQKLTLLSNTILLHRPPVKHLSSINIENRIDYTCLMLVPSAKILDGIRAILLRRGDR
jgi:hypothetical protein